MSTYTHTQTYDGNTLHTSKLHKTCLTRSREMHCRVACSLYFQSSHACSLLLQWKDAESGAPTHTRPVYVCIGICMCYVCVYVCMHVPTRNRPIETEYVCIYIYIYICHCIYVVYTCVCLLVHGQIHIHTYIYIHIYACMDFLSLTMYTSWRGRVCVY
jgi:hypothetical protein